MNGYSDINEKDKKDCKKDGKKMTHEDSNDRTSRRDIIKPLFQEIMVAQWETDHAWLEGRKAKACFYAGEVLLFVQNYIWENVTWKNIAKVQ